jgi:hypothetical protein
VRLFDHVCGILLFDEVIPDGIAYIYYLLPIMYHLPYLHEWLKEKPLPLAVEQVGSSRH